MENQELNTYWYSESYENYSKKMRLRLSGRLKPKNSVNGKRYNFCSSVGTKPWEYFCNLNLTFHDWQLVHEDNPDDIGVCGETTYD
jgi:hypothetical protein